MSSNNLSRSSIQLASGLTPSKINDSVQEVSFVHEEQLPEVEETILPVPALREETSEVGTVPLKSIMFDLCRVNKEMKFPSNYISTTHYTLISFLPVSLFYQFKKFSNIYFLAIAVLTGIPEISPFTPITSILPLAFVVVVSMVREGYEDYQRYKSDREVNN